MIDVIAHIGDPCIFCEIPHDDVQIGDCPGRQSLAMFLDAFRALESCACDEPFHLLPLEAQAILDELAACRLQTTLTKPWAIGETRGG